jgi:hypothetical protein
MPFGGGGGVRRRELPLHTKLREVVIEVARCELTPTISMQGVNLLATLPFCHRLDILDGHQHVVLGWQQDSPHVSAIVIHQQEKIAITAWRHRSDWPTYVPMHELQRLYSPSERLMRE